MSNNQMEFNVANTNPAYGCPAGLGTDPDPVIEPGVGGGGNGAAGLQAFASSGCMLVAVITAVYFDIY